MSDAHTTQRGLSEFQIPMLLPTKFGSGTKTDANFVSEPKAANSEREANYNFGGF